MKHRMLENLTLSALAAREPLERVGHRELREKLGPTLEWISASHGAIEVVNRGRSEAVVVSHDVYNGLLASQRELDDIRGTVALLLADISSGAAVPSEILDRLSIFIGSRSESTQPATATRGYGIQVR